MKVLAVFKARLDSFTNQEEMSYDYEWDLVERCWRVCVFKNSKMCCFYLKQGHTDQFLLKALTETKRLLS